jgi:hypothetical protein
MVREARPDVLAGAEDADGLEARIHTRAMPLGASELEMTVTFIVAPGMVAWPHTECRAWMTPN